MSLKYESTRSRIIQENASKAIIDGLASDGGLYVYRYIDEIKIDYEKLLGLPYVDVAYAILKELLFDFDEAELKSCIKQAYSDNFDCEDVVDLVKVADNYVLELFHGPTSAFKDLALALLPYLMTAAHQINENQDQALILTATSGDTGKAAIEGFKDVENTKIMVFYPLQGVSAIQERQMLTAKGHNVVVCGIEGDFDDAQNAVKQAMSNKNLQEQCAKKHIHLTSANSINIGRLAPQIAYYFYSYLQLVKQGEIVLNQAINFAVPTGNFGNILAGYMAKKMGLPIKTLICASNANNVLFDFLTTGIYDRNHPLYKTISPSMDILLSSNLERFLYYKSSENNEYINSLMKELKLNGKYQVDEYVLNRIKKDMYASFANDDETKQTIRKIFNKYHYLLDPHSAVAYKALIDYKLDTNDDTPCIVVATASPYKFAKDVYAAISDTDIADEYAAIDALSKLSKHPIPKNIADLQQQAILHHNKINKVDILEFIKEHI